MHRLSHACLSPCLPPSPRSMGRRPSSCMRRLQATQRPHLPLQILRRVRYEPPRTPLSWSEQSDMREPRLSLASSSANGSRLTERRMATLATFRGATGVR
jgi:hypothetical protein